MLPHLVFAACIFACLTTSSALAFEDARSESDSTVTLTLKEAEFLFLERNLELIASRFHLDIKEAEIRQARLWENPELTIEHQVINRSRSGPIGFTGSDNTVIEIEQLIFTAGKRSREIRLRELEKMEASHAFDLLLRTLKRDLREQFFELWFLTRSVQLYESQIDALVRIVDAFDSLSLQGDVARIEVMRLRALLLELEAEYASVLAGYGEAESSLRLLLRLPSAHIYPKTDAAFFEMMSARSLPDFDTLYQTSMRSRSDLRSLEATFAASRQAVRLERARAWPDVSVGVVYDKLDGVVDDYIGLTLNFQVPLWNRNQGNIRAARLQMQQTEAYQLYLRDEIEQELRLALESHARNLRLLLRLDPRFEQDFEAILETLLQQYQQGEIRLVEFIDFYESYREGLLRTFEIQNRFLQSVETLNYVVGIDVIPFYD